MALLTVHRSHNTVGDYVMLMDTMLTRQSILREQLMCHERVTPGSHGCPCYCSDTLNSNFLDPKTLSQQLLTLNPNNISIITLHPKAIQAPERQKLLEP